MVVTFAVLKLLTSRLVSALQLQNICPMFVTLLVLRFPMPLICVSFEQELNQLYVDAGRAWA